MLSSCLLSRGSGVRVSPGAPLISLESNTCNHFRNPLRFNSRSIRSNFDLFEQKLETEPHLYRCFFSKPKIILQFACQLGARPCPMMGKCLGVPPLGAVPYTHRKEVGIECDRACAPSLPPCSNLIQSTLFEAHASSPTGKRSNPIRPRPYLNP